MKYLFCSNLDEPDSVTAENSFLVDEVPSYLLSDLKQSAKEYSRALHRELFLPFLLLAVSVFLLLFGGLFVIGIIGKSVNTSLAKAWHDLPWMFWIGGILLVGSVVLFLIGQILKRCFSRQKPSQSARERLESTNETLREYLSIPKSAKEAEVLTFSYRGNEEPLKIKKDTTLHQEYTLFCRDQQICIFNDLNLYAFHEREAVRIRVIDQQIPLYVWTKEEPFLQKKYKEWGVLSNKEEMTGLRFYCALDIEHSGEMYSLCFPAYELPFFARITGLKAPDLPKV